MRSKDILRAAATGVFLSLPVMGLLSLGTALFGRSFVVFDLFDALARALPGGVVTAGIDLLVQAITALGLGPTDVVAKQLEHALAVGLFVALGAGLGALVGLLRRRAAWAPWEAGALGGGLLLLLLLGVERAVGDWLSSPGPAITLGALCLAWGALTGALAGPGRAASDPVPGRRLFLRLGVGAAVTAVATWGLGQALRRQAVATGAGQPLPPPRPTPPPPPDVRTGLRPAPGTRPELTPTEAFYRIDINLRPPQVNGQRWELVADGRFARPRRLSLADLQAFPEVTQPITLSCISNPIGGDLISTSRWTGARLRDVVEDLGLQPDAQALRLEAADGFYEYVTMDDLLDPRTLLVYGMDGATLPVTHGYPLRIYIPNRYGMKQPKWITHVEAVGQPGPGYWVERGWSAEAHPRIITIIDPIEVNGAEEANLPIGGIAWAGDRGIRQVEVQVDEGAWAAASLLTPPLGPLTWVLWRYDWPRQPGRHTFRARATDGTGATQVGEHSGPHPDGATGYHTLTVTI